jgi:predicted CoA-binding protein
MRETPTLRQILATTRTLAVVGLSPHAHRPSHEVAQYMQAHGYRIVPVNPLVAREGGAILGQPCYATVQEAAQALAALGQRIEMVNCFRKSEDIPPLAEAAIEVGAQCLWLQLGVQHAPAEARAHAAGLWVVHDRCLKIEHARLAGSLG